MLAAAPCRVWKPQGKEIAPFSKGAEHIHLKSVQRAGWADRSQTPKYDGRLVAAGTVGTAGAVCQGCTGLEFSHHLSPQHLEPLNC